MKPQPKVSGIRLKSVLKLIGYLIAVIVVLIVGLILWIVIAWNLSARHDKQAINQAVQALRLPSNYQVVKTTYTSASCLDVCAHSDITYRSHDGSELSTSTVTAELKQLGYRKSNVYDLSRTYDDKLVHATIVSDSQGSLTLDLSL